MTVSIPLESTKLVVARDLMPGALFRIVEQHKIGPLCIRAKFNDAAAYVLLNGDDRFRVKELHASVLAVPIGTYALHVQIATTQPDQVEEWAAGTLVVIEAGTFLTVGWHGYAGTHQTYRLNLLTGNLDEEDTRRYACAANWRLADCDEHVMETVLCTAGDMG